MSDTPSYKTLDHWTPRSMYDEVAEGGGTATLSRPAGRMAAVMMSEIDLDAAEAQPPPPPVDGNTIVNCACGCSVPLFAMVDVQAVPEGIRGGIRFACSGCWSRWIRRGLLTEAEFYEYLGAPEALIERVRERPDFQSARQEL